MLYWALGLQHQQQQQQQKKNWGEHHPFHNSDEREKFLLEMLS